jgi:hypothetical protein
MSKHDVGLCVHWQAVCINTDKMSVLWLAWQRRAAGNLHVEGDQWVLQRTEVLANCTNVGPFHAFAVGSVLQGPVSGACCNRIASLLALRLVEVTCTVLIIQSEDLKSMQYQRRPYESLAEL